MKRILVLGAGQSSPYLIRYLLDGAENNGWFVTVGDRNIRLAKSRVGDHAWGEAIRLDINDTHMLSSQIRAADVVVNFLPAKYLSLIGRDCVHNETSMVSVSYRNADLRAMHRDARRQGVLLLCEMGLDPGLDLMSAMTMIHRVQHDGGVIESFESYGGGVAAPDGDDNPLRYVITWNPRNVVMSGLTAGADVLVHEVCRTSTLRPAFDAIVQLRLITEYHADSVELGELVARVGVPTVVLTHFIPAPGTAGLTAADYEADLRSSGFGGEVVIGEDLTTVTIPADRRRP